MEIYKEEELMSDTWLDIFTELTECIVSNINNLIISRNKRWKKIVDDKLQEQKPKKKEKIKDAELTFIT